MYNELRNYTNYCTNYIARTTANYTNYIRELQNLHELHELHLLQELHKPLNYTNYKNRLAHELQKLHFRNIKPIFKARNQYLISTTRKCEIFFYLLLSLNINFVSVFLMNRLLFLIIFSRISSPGAAGSQSNWRLHLSNIDEFIRRFTVLYNSVPFRSILYSFWGLTSYNNILYTLGNTRMLRLKPLNLALTSYSHHLFYNQSTWSTFSPYVLQVHVTRNMWRHSENNIAWYNWD